MHRRGRRMNRAEAAEYLGISERTLFTLSVELNQIPYYKLQPHKKNSPVWYYESDLDDWLESKRIMKRLTG